jgi:hypothetical protein
MRPFPEPIYAENNSPKRAIPDTPCLASPCSERSSRSASRLKGSAKDWQCYLTYGPDAANVLHHVVNDRHLRERSMVFTTNKPLNAWGRVLHDPDLAAAILDRRALRPSETLETGDRHPSGCPWCQSFRNPHLSESDSVRLTA